VRNFILQEFISLDGFAAGPHGAVDFIPASTRDDRTFGQEQLALRGHVAKGALHGD
jgi:hypothetical protein